MPPAIYSIPPEQPFLDTLVAGLMRRAGTAPLALARMIVLLPTRRAARSLREAFLRAGNGAAMLLPRMLPVGDLDPDELALLADESESGDGFEVPPAVPELRRRLLLTQLVRKYAESGGDPIALGPLPLGQAAPLARELARFLDEAHAEGCDLAKLGELVPQELAEHWRQVVAFLDILRVHWPAILSSLGCLDPGERRNRLLAAQAEAWRLRPPPGPVIAAGITGGVPAVAALMKVVAQLPQGAVVLPGLDAEADGAMWELILADPAHPQHVMAKFLDELGVERGAVEPWLRARAALPRATLLREALAPAALTHRWRFVSGLDARALDGLRRLDCAGPQEEAGAIALLLREALEEPGRTAALVTPDRDLARRVAAELRRWDIDIDDSAGLPLNRTPPGVFLRLVLDLAAEQWAPLPLLAVLKHPLCGCGLPSGAIRERVRALEQAALRGARPKPGAAGLRELLPAERRLLRDLVDRVDAATAPLIAALAAGKADLATVVAAHIACCESLAASDEESGAARLWREPAGEAAALFLNELLQEAQGFPEFRGGEYPALFESLLAGPVVRPSYGRHPRLFIWGLLEARLQQADLIVLGGLNEGVWPAAIGSDPWLSRPMRQSFGLPPPERRIGGAAHDFALALSARVVVMTRAARVEGTPTVPSRWLLRLDTVLRAAGIENRLGADAAPLSWQAKLDTPAGPPRPAVPPAPSPPRAARPRKLSITEIETWRRDPYAIYARHVLRLKALEPLDADPGAADRGIVIHDALANFLKAYPKQLPGDAMTRLLALGEQSFGPLLARPGIWAFWWPRYRRIAEWIAALEAERRPLLDDVLAEINGKMTLDAPGGPFEIVGRADRIERRRDGTVAIVDYKTGGVPEVGEIAEGFTPQLALEAAMIEQGGFTGIAKSAVGELAYWKLGGGDPAGKVMRRADEPAELRALIDRTLAGMKELIAAFDDPTRPYLAMPRLDRAPRYSDYAHLERVKEWQAGEEEEE
ncbi:MAG TPA: double-strand break repair protein AddB [Stellaceae bacterium]|jgi:ATP-dependent helicase/nuclease subunit B